MMQRSCWGSCSNPESRISVADARAHIWVNDAEKHSRDVELAKRSLYGPDDTFTEQLDNNPDDEENSHEVLSWIWCDLRSKVR